VVIQIITAVCALVTGQAIEKNKRSTDKIEQIDDAAKIKVAEAEAAQTIAESKADKPEVKP
jgi:hypothetical protein